MHAASFFPVGKFSASIVAKFFVAERFFSAPVFREKTRGRPVGTGTSNAAAQLLLLLGHCLPAAFP